MSTKKTKRERTLNNTTSIETKLDDIVLNSVNEIMKICFYEFSYKFSYKIENESDGVLTFYMNIDNIFLDKHVLLIGQFINDEEFYSQINMVKSNMGYRTGNFLFDIFIYISILIGVSKIKLENDTDYPLRAAKGIYSMFEPVNEYDEDEIYENLKYHFDNYDELDKIYDDIKYDTIKSNLKNNTLFMSLKKQYNNFDDIPENLQNDVLLEEILIKNDGEMIYNVQRGSLLEIKNKIYKLVKQVDLIDEPENPWNQNVYEELKKKKIRGKKLLGGKCKTKKCKIKKCKTKKCKIKKCKTKKCKIKKI
jgi:hypothetical protein